MSPESVAVLIVASDSELRRYIRESLQPTGFRLAEARSTPEAVDMVCQKSFDIALLDMGVPDHGAAHSCRSLRAQSPGIGIIVVRENGNGDDEDLCFEAGADDCVATPFRFREIVARIGVILKRTPAMAPLELTDISPRAGNLAIDIDIKRRMIWRRGQPVHLSPREFALLAALMARAGSAITHERLVRSAWGSDTGKSRACLRTYIKALRQKLEEEPARPRYIVTEPWVGYSFQNPHE
jgi:two-component system KDP operon response regulator KdpE